MDDVAGPALTRSEAETRFLVLPRKGGVPRPEVNSVVSGLDLDFFCPGEGVVAKSRGRRRNPGVFAESLAVIRFTWRQIEMEPAKVLVRLSMALGAGTRKTRK